MLFVICWINQHPSIICFLFKQGFHDVIHVFRTYVAHDSKQQCLNWIPKLWFISLITFSFTLLWWTHTRRRLAAILAFNYGSACLFHWSSLVAVKLHVESKIIGAHGGRHVNTVAHVTHFLLRNMVIICYECMESQSNHVPVGMTLTSTPVNSRRFYYDECC